MNETAKIELEDGLCVLIDKDMEKYLNRFKWTVFSDKKMFYVKTAFGQHKGPQVRMHHLVVGFPPKGFVCDHINRNGLDNRRENLRIVTQRVNCMNRRDRKDSFGMYFTKDGKWNARIVFQGKRISAGRYETKELAYQAYLKKLKEIDPVSFNILQEENFSKPSAR